jgi:hypothetical protein
MQAQRLMFTISTSSTIINLHRRFFYAHYHDPAYVEGVTVTNMAAERIMQSLAEIDRESLPARRWWQVFDLFAFSFGCSFARLLGVSYSTLIERVSFSFCNTSSGRRRILLEDSRRVGFSLSRRQSAFSGEFALLHGARKC